MQNNSQTSLSTSQQDIQKINSQSKSLANKSGELDLEHTLNKLSELLEKAIAIAEENRQIAIDHYYDEKQYLDEQRKVLLVSEDGVLEKNCTASLKLIQDSTEVLANPINALTKILSAKLIANGSSEVRGPVDIHALKKNFT